MQYDYENILKSFSNLNSSNGSFELFLTLLISKHQCSDFTFNYSDTGRSYFQVRSTSLVYSCDFHIFNKEIEYIMDGCKTKSNFFLKELMNGANRSYEASVSIIVPVYGKLQFRVHSMPTTDGVYMNARLLQIQRNISTPNKSYGYLILLMHILSNYTVIKYNLTDKDLDLVMHLYLTITEEPLDLKNGIPRALKLLEDYKLLYDVERI